MAGTGEEAVSRIKSKSIRSSIRFLFSFSPFLSEELADAGEECRLIFHHLESKIFQTSIRHLFFFSPPPPSRGRLGAGEECRLKIHHLESKVLQTSIRHLYSFISPPPPSRGRLELARSALSEAAASMDMVSAAAESGGPLRAVTRSEPVPTRQLQLALTNHPTPSPNPGWSRSAPTGVIPRLPSTPAPAPSPWPILTGCRPAPQSP